MSIQTQRIIFFPTLVLSLAPTLFAQTVGSDVSTRISATGQDEETQSPTQASSSAPVDNSDPWTTSRSTEKLSVDEREQQWHYDACIGILQPTQQAVLRPGTTGNIQELHVQEGQYVKHQQSLLTLDDRIAQARLELAKIEAEGNAAERTAEIDVELRRKELALLRQAGESAAASQFEIDRKAGEFERAVTVQESERRRTKQLLGSVRLSQAELDTLTLTAPFDAYVLRIHKDVGNSIGPGEDAITVVQLHELKSELYLPMQYFGMVDIGRKLELTVLLPDRDTISAEVKYVSPVINPASGSFRCVLTVDNADLKIPSGLKVSLDLNQLPAASHFTAAKAP
ncbi:MAG: efflux RND transporter periplasmic adaptor subunit [Planctomycetales bacterium]|nr:efflux RND transporter periplasmic adaptor subunit [Planctomycetales bacterium]